MGLWSDWRVGRARHRRASLFLAQINAPIDQEQLRLLSEAGVARDFIERELIFARRAVGLIVADRDALDDRTASEIAHGLAPVVAAETRRNESLGLEWNARWRAYTGALAVRGTADSPAMRLARVLLGGAGIAQPSGEQLQVGTEIIQQMRVTLNDALRRAFGAASMPEDIRPSAIQGRSARESELL